MPNLYESCLLRWFPTHVNLLSSDLSTKISYTGNNGHNDVDRT